MLIALGAPPDRRAARREPTVKRSLDRIDEIGEALGDPSIAGDAAGPGRPEPGLRGLDPRRRRRARGSRAPARGAQRLDRRRVRPRRARDRLRDARRVREGGGRRGERASELADERRPDRPARRPIAESMRAARRRASWTRRCRSPRSAWTGPRRPARRPAWSSARGSSATRSIARAGSPRRATSSSAAPTSRCVVDRAGLAPDAPGVARRRPWRRWASSATATWTRRSRRPARSATGSARRGSSGSAPRRRPPAATSTPRGRDFEASTAIAEELGLRPALARGLRTWGEALRAPAAATRPRPPIAARSRCSRSWASSAEASAVRTELALGDVKIAFD